MQVTLLLDSPLLVWLINYLMLYLTNKQERLDFINSLNDDLLDNLYIWRLGFDIPNLRNKKIDSLLESVWKIKN